MQTYEGNPGRGNYKVKWVATRVLTGCHASSTAKAFEVFRRKKSKWPTTQYTTRTSTSRETTFTLVPRPNWLEYSQTHKGFGQSLSGSQRWWQPLTTSTNLGEMSREERHRLCTNSAITVANRSRGGGEKVRRPCCLSPPNNIGNFP